MPSNAIEAPLLNKSQVSTLATKCYDTEEIIAVQVLDSYDDKNFWIKCRGDKGYVLKVTNRAEAKCEGLADAQTSLMEYVREIGKVPVPGVIRRKDGALTAIEEMPDGTRLPVRMIEYVNGILLIELAFIRDLIFEIGTLLAQVVFATHSFHHPAYDHYKPVWSMEKLNDVMKLINYLENDHQKQLVKNGIQLYQMEIEKNGDLLRKWLIHSDLNEANIIMKQTNDDKYQVAALLDFGDAHIAPGILELTNTILYMMIGSIKHGPKCAPLDVGGIILAAYITKMMEKCADNSILPALIFTRDELLFARSALIGRLCMSLAYGDYLLKTQKLGWETLESLFGLSDSELLEHWAKVAFSKYGVKILLDSSS